MTLSGRAAALILLAAAGAGLLFALAASPGNPRPSLVADTNASANAVTITLVPANEAGAANGQ
jgi:hypothetical protein